MVVFVCVYVYTPVWRFNKKTCFINCYYSFAFHSKIAFRVLPRPNFFYITFFVVNATVVFVSVYFKFSYFLFVYFGFYISELESKIDFCLVFVWFFSCPFKLRLFTNKKWNSLKRDARSFRSAVPTVSVCLSVFCECVGVGVSVKNYPVFASGF